MDKFEKQVAEICEYFEIEYNYLTKDNCLRSIDCIFYYLPTNIDIKDFLINNVTNKDTVRVSAVQFGDHYIVTVEE